VITPLFRARPGDKKIDKATGEVHYPRAEHDAALHVEGTGEMVWGTKFVLIAARLPHPHSRFILDAAYVPTPGGEAGTAVERFVALEPCLPGAHGVVYDTALRGVHHQLLMRELGWISINRVTAASGSRKQGGGKDRKRVEKLVYVETKTVATPGGPAEVRLLSQGGRVGLGEASETGEPVFVPLERVRTHRNPDKRGTYRWYNDYRLPGHMGGGLSRFACTRRTTTSSGSSTGPRMSVRSHPAIRTSKCCTGVAMTQRASTVTSTTRCGCAALTRSGTADSC